MIIIITHYLLLLVVLMRYGIHLVNVQKRSFSCLESYLMTDVQHVWITEYSSRNTRSPFYNRMASNEFNSSKQ